MPCDCRLAIGGVMRGGARASFLTALVVSTIDGVRTGSTASRRVLIDSLSIHDALNETANTATFTVQGARPNEGAEVVFALQSINNSTRLFAGHLTKITMVTLVQNPHQAVNVVWQCEATDYTWQLNERLVIARYRGQSATAIVRDLVATWAPAGYTTIAVQPNLPYLDEITMTNTPVMAAIQQVAQRIGGYAEVDYFRDVHLWTGDSPRMPALRAITADHPTAHEIAYARDLSQIVTRALVEGGGVNALAAIAPGANVIPVEDDAWYDVQGGLVVSGPQRIRYTGVIAGGAGSVVGSTVAPSSAPTATLQAGAGITLGVHGYAYTFVTAAGPTKPGPITTITIGGVTDPTAPTVATQDPPNGSPYNASFISIGDTVTFCWAYSTAASTSGNYAQTSVASPPSAPLVTISNNDPLNPAKSAPITIRAVYTADPRVTELFLYMSSVKGSTNGLRFCLRIANQPSAAGGVATFSTNGLSVPSASGQLAPVTNTTSTAQVQLSGIAPGPATTTSRRIYRTAANLSQLKLLTTIADNTTTTFLDALADASLGANAPTADTSGLVGTTGQINAGEPAINMSSTSAFPASGWALLNNQIISYAAKTPTTITGIPPTGEGAITATVPFGTVITVAPQLIGIPASGAGAIRWAILKGDPVNLLVILDDLAAQAALKALVGGDGVQESYLQDNRIGLAEASDRAQALLQQRTVVLETVTFRSRDPNTRTGQTVGVNLPAPTQVQGYYKIQDVQIGSFHPYTYAVYQVTASSQRYTFEDLLRQQRR